MRSKISPASSSAGAVIRVRTKRAWRRGKLGHVADGDVHGPVFQGPQEGHAAGEPVELRHQQRRAGLLASLQCTLKLWAGRREA